MHNKNTANSREQVHVELEYSVQSNILDQAKELNYSAAAQDQEAWSYLV